MKKFLLFLGFVFCLYTNAQITTLLNFDTATNGIYPSGPLISDGTYLYGATMQGGVNGRGTLYKIKPNGTGYASWFDFNTPDDIYPNAGLYSDGTYLYGTAAGGGTSSVGGVYKIKPDGTGFTDVFDFNLANGNTPQSELISDGTYLYGTTYYSGVSGGGVLFRVKPNGTGFDTLLMFNGANGANPVGALVTDGTYLYGVTYAGGISNSGVLYKIKTDGSGYTKLLDFYNNNIDGAYPKGGLYTDGTYLYGTASASNYGGLIFKIKPDGTGYTDLYEFDGPTGNGPVGSVISDGTYLYGVTSEGGTSNAGIIYRIKPDGTGFANLANFDTLNGANPVGSLYYDGTDFYGVTYIGGTTNQGTIFKYRVACEALNFDGTNDYVSVPDNAALNFGSGDFTIQVAFQSTSSQPDSAGLVVKAGNSSGYQLMLVGNKISASVYDATHFLGVADGLQGTYPLNDGFWYMLTMVVNKSANNIKLYLDSYVDADVTNPLVSAINVSNPASMLVGTDKTKTNFISGNIDEVRIWNRALCGAEIARSGVGEIPGNSPGLVAYYNFDEGFDNANNTGITQLTDSASNVLNGTLSNFALTNDVSNWIVGGTVSKGNKMPVFSNNLSAVATHTNVTCNGLSNGIASVVASGYSPYTYSWSSGISTTDSVATGLAIGNYTCTINNGCGSIAKTFTITQPNPINTGVTVNGATLSANNSSATSYYWINCNNGNAPIVGSAHQSYVATANGSYAVVLHMGSCSDTSTCNNITNIGIAQNQTVQNYFTIYPNPAQNNFTIETSSAEKQMVFIFDVNGKLVLNQFINGATTIDASNLNAGVYSLNITSNQGAITKKLVIVK